MKEKEQGNDKDINGWRAPRDGLNSARLSALWKLWTEKVGDPLHPTFLGEMSQDDNDDSTKIQ